jgi:hypothetical protein
MVEWIPIQDAYYIGVSLRATAMSAAGPAVEAHLKRDRWGARRRPLEDRDSVRE